LSTKKTSLYRGDGKGDVKGKAKKAGGKEKQKTTERMGGERSGASGTEHLELFNLTLYNRVRDVREKKGKEQGKCALGMSLSRKAEGVGRMGVPNTGHSGRV